MLAEAPEIMRKHETPAVFILTGVVLRPPPQARLIAICHLYLRVLCPECYTSCV